MVRKTIQRSLTLEAVKKLNSHPTADEVYGEIIASYPTISRTTVYRNLNQLVESGELCKVTLVEGADRFDCRLDRHHHIRCMGCKRLFDVEMPQVPDLKNAVADKQGFDFIDFDIVFQGVCPACKKKNTKEELYGTSTAYGARADRG